VTWLFFVELTNGQTAMLYSRHCLTASLVSVTALTYASTNGPWGRPLAHWSVHQKINRVSLVQFSYIMALCSDLKKTF